MARTTTLTWRLVIMVVFITGGVLLLFSILAFVRLDSGARSQDRAISQLVRERFSEQLRLQTRLVSNEFTRMEADTSRSIAGLARHQDIAMAMASGNIVAIDRILKTAQVNGPLDAILAVDVDLKSLGSHQPGLILYNANEAVNDSTLGQVGVDLLAASSREKTVSHTQLVVIEEKYARAVGLDFVSGNKLTVASLYPVFDDFGDLIGALIGHKWVHTDNANLLNLVRSEQLGIRLFAKGQLVLEAGEAMSPDKVSQTAALRQMRTTQSGDYLYKCSQLKPGWRLCIYEPIAHLTRLTGQFVQFAENEKLSLMAWMGVMALISIIGATVFSFVATRRVIAPLHQIKDAVRSVARGNWLADVSGETKEG